MFFRYSYTDAVEVWLYYIITTPGTGYPDLATLENDYQVLHMPGTIYNLYMYSVVVNLTKFLLGFFSSFFYSKSRNLSYSWHFRKVICSFIILFIYHALVFIAVLFEFVIFSLIASYFIYAVRIATGYEHSSYTEYLAWEVKEHWRLALIILFVLHEENRWTNVKHEFWEDVESDVTYYYNNRNVPRETVYEIYLELKDGYNELNKDKTITACLTYAVIFTLYYNQYTDPTTCGLLFNDIIYM